ncbi:MAG: hypothetical protein U0792_24005 [Gemmataceae bacterium]
MTATPTRSLLVADADTFVGRLVRRMFEDASWTVTVASSRESAIAALNERRFDRLLINCYPPTIQGLGVLAARPGTLNATTPAGVLAGPAMSEIAEAKRLGAAWVREFAEFRNREELFHALTDPDAMGSHQPALEPDS